MTSGQTLFIPAVTMVGVFLCFLVGKRAVERSEDGCGNRLGEAPAHDLRAGGRPRDGMIKLTPRRANARSSAQTVNRAWNTGERPLRDAACLDWAEQQFRDLGFAKRAANEHAAELVASIQGTALVAHTLRSRDVCAVQFRRVERGLDATFTERVPT